MINVIYEADPDEHDEREYEELKLEEEWDDEKEFDDMDRACDIKCEMNNDNGEY